MKTQRITFKDILFLIAVILTGLILLSGLVGVNRWAAGTYGQGVDFLPAWNGARAFLFENLDPYTRTIAERTQTAAYGRIAQDGEYPYFLDIPFPLLIIFFPIALISDPIWARTIWMTFSEIGLMLLGGLALRLADWQPKRWFFIYLLVFSLTWFYSLISILDGTFSPFLILVLVGVLLAMRGFNDELAGFLLAISSMKWEITSLLWLLIIIGVYATRRWRVFYGWGMTWFVLAVIGFLIYPNWFWPFMRSVAGNWREGTYIILSNILDETLPGIGKGLALLIAGGLLLFLLIDWYSSIRSRDFRRVGWAAAFAVGIAPLVGLPIVAANLSPLIFSIAFILPFVWERWKKYSYLFISLVVLFFFALPLILGWLEVSNRIHLEGLSLFIPSIFIVLLLFLIRWTLVSPPRTWLDGVKRELNK